MTKELDVPRLRTIFRGLIGKRMTKEIDVPRLRTILRGLVGKRMTKELENEVDKRPLWPCATRVTCGLRGLRIIVQGSVGKRLTIDE